MTVHRKLVANIAIACCLLSAGCSGSQSPQVPGSQQAARTTTTSSVDPCGGVSPAQAASILQIPSADVVGPTHFKTFSCSYHSDKNSFASLNFNLYATPSAAAAGSRLNAIKENLGFLSPSVAVADLGDEAWYFPDSRARRLLMRKGSVWLDVTTPGDKASQIRIARIVAENLP